MGETTERIISFREMKAADIPAVVKIEAEAFYDAWNESMLLNEINNINGVDNVELIAIE